MTNQDLNIEARVAKMVEVSLGPEKIDDRRPLYVAGVGYVGDVHAQDQTLVITKPSRVAAYEAFVRDLTARNIPYREQEARAIQQPPVHPPEKIRIPVTKPSLRWLWECFQF